MSSLPLELVRMVVRQATHPEPADDEAPGPGNCSSANDYDGRMGVRISSIFVILIGSLLGAVFPTIAKRSRLNVPESAFFVAKFFGSGVIIATAFIHLLAPANEALSNECLTGPITEYPWVEAIALMTVFVMFFSELMAMRYANFSGDEPHHGQSTVRLPDGAQQDSVSLEDRQKHTPSDDEASNSYGDARVHPDVLKGGLTSADSYSAQLTAIFILEFGVIFHSVFIGLTLAVSGEEFTTLYIVLVFHQTFEGLGLGSRLATVPWPASRRWTPYVLGVAYGFSTPIAIAIGLGVRTSYPPESATTLIANGIFDSISAGILLYTGLIELMAHEFLFSPHMLHGTMKRLMAAFFLMCLGAALMALLGKWA